MYVSVHIKFLTIIFVEKDFFIDLMSKIYYFLNYFYTYGEERRSHFEASFYKNYILNVYKIRYQTLKFVLY